MGGGVKSAEPTYNRVLPGAELDQEREMKMKDMKKAGRQERNRLEARKGTGLKD